MFRSGCSNVVLPTLNNPCYQHCSRLMEQCCLRLINQQRENSVVGITDINGDISDVLWCEQFAAILLQQAITPLITSLFNVFLTCPNKVDKTGFSSPLSGVGGRNLNKHTNRQTSLLDMKFSLFWNKKIQISEQIQTKELITVKVQR